MPHRAAGQSGVDMIGKMKTYREIDGTELRCLTGLISEIGREIAYRKPDHSVEVPGGTHMVYHHSDGSKTYLFKPAGQEEPGEAILIGREEKPSTSHP